MTEPRTPDIIDAEVIEDRTPARQPAQTGDRGVTLFGTSNPAEVITQATEIANAIIQPILDQKLYVVTGTDRDGKERRHVFVEGWTLLGSILGVAPVETWTRKIEDGDGRWAEPETQKHPGPFHSQYCKCGRPPYALEYAASCQVYTPDKPRTITIADGRGGWEARVEARLHDGTIVGAAEAECRWSEQTWSTRDSYALRSMAQTRATSKALRLPLSFLMVLAGFQATPAEEIPIGEYGSSPTTGGGPASFAGDADPEEPDPYESTIPCPSCGTKVLDQRNKPDRGKQPQWKCPNRACTGGNLDKNGKRWSWASFDSWPWDWADTDGGDYTNSAKAKILELVTDHFDEARFRILDATGDDAFGDDPKAAAAILWQHICDGTGLTPPLTRDGANEAVEAARSLVRAPATPFDAFIDNDPDDGLTEDDYGNPYP